MTQISFKSAGVSARTIDLTGPTAIQPSGIPAGIIGTAIAGPAFVPVTLATTNDFIATFGETTNNVYVGPLAVSEWLRSAQAATWAAHGPLSRAHHRHGRAHAAPECVEFGPEPGTVRLFRASRRPDRDRAGHLQPRFQARTGRKEGPRRDTRA